MNELEEKTRSRLERNAFMLHNYMELESVEPDRAVFALTIRPESCNPYGMVHGGRHLHPGGQRHRRRRPHRWTVLCHPDQRTAFPAQPVSGVVRPLPPCAIRGKVHGAHRCGHRGEGGKLLATGEFTFFCVDKDSWTGKVSHQNLKKIFSPVNWISPAGTMLE